MWIVAFLRIETYLHGIQNILSNGIHGNNIGKAESSLGIVKSHYSELSNIACIRSF